MQRVALWAQGEAGFSRAVSSPLVWIWEIVLVATAFWMNREPPREPVFSKKCRVFLENFRVANNPVIRTKFNQGRLDVAARRLTPD
jgi:hypothetical protein